MKREQSNHYYARARERISGGVNSPSRSYDAVGGGAPVFIAKGKGAYLYDVDGNSYIDYLGAYGAMILGHAPDVVQKAVSEAVAEGTVFGAPTPREVLLAEELTDAIDGLEKVRFTASGTEAVMTAIRVARGFTDREKVLKFDGAYHGHSDLVLVSAGSGSSTLGIDESLGVTEGVAKDVISIPYDDIPSLRQAFDERGDEIAAVLVEPITGNFGLVVPSHEFLSEIQSLAKKNGALVIWDEVITAFRFGYGSIQQHFDLRPDMYTLGKVIGGGLPIGAYGGRSDVMGVVAPLGGVYQDGTLSGNPVSMAAALACLNYLKADPSVYQRLERFAKTLAEGMEASAKTHGVNLSVTQFGGALSPFFRREAPRRFDETEEVPDGHLGRFFNLLLEQGIMTAPSKYEAWFVSCAHTESEIDRTLEAVDLALATMAKEGFV